MWFSKIKIQLSLLSLLVLTSCDNKSTMECSMPLNYSSVINEATELQEAYPMPGAPLTLNSFQAIYEQPEEYFVDAFTFLSDSANTLDQKIVCVYSMQNLEDKMYKSFLEKLYQLCKDKKVDEQVFMSALFPGKVYSSRRAINDTKLISELLHEVVKDKLFTPPNISALKKLSDGSLEKRIKLFDKEVHQ
jgi:hypothetical protein